MGFPLYVTYCFSLAACNILSLCLIFVSLTSMCLGVFLLGFILYGTRYTSWIWLTISFSMLGKFSIIISSKTFLYPFFFSSSSVTPIIRMLVHLTLSQRSQTVISSFHSFYFILLFRSYFHHFIFQLTDSFFCFRYSAIVPFRVVLISLTVLFVSACLFFNSSRSFLIESWIFLHSVFKGFFHLYYHYSEFFSGSLPISSSFIWTSVFLVCFFICVVSLCLFITFF